MEEVRYMISEASKRVDVEAHVLRYWEEELELPITRNEMGHRYYRETDIELLKTVKYLKDQGFQLKAVKMLLPDIQSLETMDNQSMQKLKEELNGKAIGMWNEGENTTKENEGTSLISSNQEHEIKEDVINKVDQFKAIMNHIIISALKENNTDLSEKISVNVTDSVVKEMSCLMKIQEEKEEERFKRFDATLRDFQKSRMLAAASSEAKNRKKSKFFKKNKVYI